MKKLTLMLAAVLLLLVPVFAFSVDSFNDDDAFLKIVPNAELGFTKVLYHTLQFGANGYVFDYVNNGGQEILFLFQRYSIDAVMADRHTVTLLYQPLTLETQTRVPAGLTAGIRVDDVVFPAGTALDLKYGFDFWRLSYLFSFVKTERFDVGAGLSLQLRNASIVFESIDGSGLTINQNVGPVPIIKLKAQYRAPTGYFIGLEADGFYASSAIFNGADFPFTGWVYDAALRGGTEVNPAADVFLSVRILGGGATGTSAYDTTFWTKGVEQYTSNNLTALIISGGLRLK